MSSARTSTNSSRGGYAMAVSAKQQPVATTRASTARPASAYVGTTLRYVLLVLLSLFAFTPFILSFLGTFKTSAEINAFPPQILPEQWRFDNWVRVWNFTIPSVQ